MENRPVVLLNRITDTYHSQKVLHTETGEAFTVFYVFCELEANRTDLRVAVLLDRMDKSDPEKKAVIKVTAGELEAGYTLAGGL